MGWACLGNIHEYMYAHFLILCDKQWAPQVYYTIPSMRQGSIYLTQPILKILMCDNTGELGFISRYLCEYSWPSCASIYYGLQYLLDSYKQSHHLRLKVSIHRHHDCLFNIIWGLTASDRQKHVYTITILLDTTSYPRIHYWSALGQTLTSNGTVTKP